jgi:CHAT domain-containing protein/tetratricopeptide (TPR) repeat protein
MRPRTLARFVVGTTFAVSALAGGAASSLASVGPAAAPCDDALPTDGLAIECEVAPEAVRRHPLTLAAGQFVAVQLREKAARVGLTFLDPAGTPIARRETSGDSMTSFRLLAVAAADGGHMLEVRALFPGASGPYQVRLEAPRPAGEADRLRASADEARAEALREASRGTPDARRKALERLDAAEAGFRQAEDRIGLALAWYDRGSVQVAMGDRGATQSFERSLELFREAGDAEGEAAALAGLGRVRLRQGELAEAGSFFEQALARAEGSGNARTLSYLTSNTGVVHARAGRYESAIERFARAVALAATSADARTEARSLTNLANAYKDLGDYERAIKIYERSLALWQRVNQREGEMLTLTNLGNVYLIQDDVERAQAILERALSLSEGTDTDDEGRVLVNLADIDRRRGNYARAVSLAERSLALRRRVGNPRGIASSLEMLGQCLQASGESERALRHLSEALAIQRSIQDVYLQSETLVRMAELERARGRLREALPHAEQAVALVESLRAAVTSPELRASFVAVERGKYDALVDILMRLHEREPASGHDAAALTVSERAGARVLLDSLVEARADIRAGVEPGLLARERELQERLGEGSARLSGLLARESTPPEEVSRARQELDARSVEYAEVQALIRRQSPRYAALTQPTPPTLEQVRQDALDDDTILLEYYLGDDRSFLWAVGPRALVSQALPERARIEGQARRVHELLTERQRSRDAAAVRAADAALRTESAALSQALLGGVAPRLATDWKGKRLLIVAPGALAYVPFGALPLPGSSAPRPLLLDHEIVYAPSASVLIAARREPGASADAPPSVAVVADPVFEASDPRVHGARTRRIGVAPPGPIGLTRALQTLGRDHFPRLPFSRAEAAAIESFVPARALLRATDFAASRQLVEQGALSDRRIVHFATHGILDTQHPDLSGLVLSLVDEKGEPRDGFLRMHEIYNLRLPADLVVLSACQTALGREVRGEGLIGLTRGFMYAGARRVIATLWQVDDESTAELMKRFYRALLREGQPPAAALRTAQAEMSRDRRWSSPFHWAAFTMQGDWR